MKKKSSKTSTKKKKFMNGYVTDKWSMYSYLVNVRVDEKTGKWEEITGQELKPKKNKQIYEAIVILHGRIIRVK